MSELAKARRALLTHDMPSIAVSLLITAAERWKAGKEFHASINLGGVVEKGFCVDVGMMDKGNGERWTIEFDYSPPSSWGWPDEMTDMASDLTCQANVLLFGSDCDDDDELDRQWTQCYEENWCSEYGDYPVFAAMADRPDKYD